MSNGEWRVESRELRIENEGVERVERVERVDNRGVDIMVEGSRYSKALGE